MTYEEALKYIHKIGSLGSKPGLGRITELCRRLGDPQDKLRFVHVGGTNGKGSFCSMLSSVLGAAGYKTGLYTSPFVRRFNERVMLNGTPVSDAKLTELMTRVSAEADKMDDRPTEFELITALAFLYYAEENCDVVVLEVGLGGRLDATNIIKTPVLSVVTGISLDHTAILGDTVEKIAAEKAGIFRAGVPVLSGAQDKGAAAVIADRAAALGCPFTEALTAPVTVKSCTLDGSVFDYKSRRDVAIPLCGIYQPENAARVLDAVDLLRAAGFTLSEDAVRRGLATAVWPARFELLRRRPVTVFDGGHNPEGIDALMRSLSTVFEGEKFVFLTGVMRDKDHAKMVDEIAAKALAVFTFAPDNPRAMDAFDYAAEYRAAGVSATGFGTTAEALDAATAEAVRRGAAMVICGSLYSYAEIRDLLDAQPTK